MELYVCKIIINPFIMSLTSGSSYLTNDSPLHSESLKSWNILPLHLV